MLNTQLEHPLQEADNPEGMLGMHEGEHLNLVGNFLEYADEDNVSRRGRGDRDFVPEFEPGYVAPDLESDEFEIMDAEGRLRDVFEYLTTRTMDDALSSPDLRFRARHQSSRGTDLLCPDGPIPWLPSLRSMPERYTPITKAEIARKRMKEAPEREAYSCDEAPFEMDGFNPKLAGAIRDVCRLHVMSILNNADEHTPVISDIIRAIRFSYNMRQREFAEQIGIAPGTISAYETGKKTPVRASSIFSKFIDGLLGMRPGFISTVGKRDQRIAYEHVYPSVAVSLANYVKDLEDLINTGG